MLRAIDMELRDDYDLCEGLDRLLGAAARGWTWSSVADTLTRAAAAPAGCEDRRFYEHLPARSAEQLGHPRTRRSR